MSVTPPYFVITGGPGAGKTTLIEALAHDGFAVSPEAGRDVIREQQARGGRALPWLDRPAFAEEMLARDVRAYEALRAQPGPVFFDRGIPDVIGYLRLEGLDVPEPMRRAARDMRYRRQVFICPPWPEIYTTDSERRQSAETAERTYRAMVAVYTAYGYALTHVPRLGVDARARFVRATIAGAG